VIPRKTQLGIVVLTAFVAASYWASRGQNDSRLQPTPGLDTQLDFALQDFEYQFFDLNGVPSARLSAPELSNHAASGISEVSNPVFDIMEHGVPWQIIAESATVAADKEHVILKGDVKIRRPASELGGELNISTSELTFEVSPKIASSEHAVHLIQDNDIMEAVGFSVDMINNRYQLLDRVKLTYAINP
jgi:LPS export ABC transporter protein LptC